MMTYYATMVDGLSPGRTKMRWRVAMLNLVDSGLIQPVRDQVSSLGMLGVL